MEFVAACGTLLTAAHNTTARTYRILCLQGLCRNIPGRALFSLFSSPPAGWIMPCICHMFFLLAICLPQVCLQIMLKNLCIIIIITYACKSASHCTSQGPSACYARKSGSHRTDCNGSSACHVRKSGCPCTSAKFWQRLLCLLCSQDYCRSVPMVGATQFRVPIKM